MKKERVYKRDRQESRARIFNDQAVRAMHDDALGWYLGFCQPGREFIGQSLIDEAGYPAYLPMVMRWRKTNRYVKQKKRFAFPVMPGCVFIGMQRGMEQWFNFFECQRVVKRVMGVSGVPRALSGREILGFIDGNHRHFSPHKAEQFMRSNHEFAEGDKVQIMDGAMDGHIVDVTEIKGKKAKIITELFGCRHEAFIGLDKLEKAV